MASTWARGRQLPVFALHAPPVSSSECALDTRCAEERGGLLRWQPMLVVPRLSGQRTGSQLAIGPPCLLPFSFRRTEGCCWDYFAIGVRLLCYRCATKTRNPSTTDRSSGSGT